MVTTLNVVVGSNSTSPGFVAFAVRRQYQAPIKARERAIRLTAASGTLPGHRAPQTRATAFEHLSALKSSDVGTSPANHFGGLQADRTSIGVLALDVTEWDKRP